MSQQMNFDEEQRGYSTGYTPHASYEDEPNVRPPVNEPQGYKLGQYQSTPRSTVSQPVSVWRSPLFQSSC